MRESDANADRRNFIKSAAAVGLLGAVGAPSALGESPQAATQEAPVTDQLRAPAGIAPGGLLDQRFPASYQTAIPTAVKVMTDYFAALSQRDLKGMAELCHFPFATFEGPTVVTVKSADDLMAKAPASMGTTLTPLRWSDHDSYLQPGCYDIFAGMEVLNSNPVCANLALSYYRYDSAGRLLLQCQGVYVITNNDGKWGIELMSTIFTPADIVGKVHSETIEAGIRARIIHDIGPNTNDSEADLYDYQYGPRVGISAGGGGFFGIRRPNEDPMASFKTEGVKTRLDISEFKQGPISPDATLNIRQSGGNVNDPTDVAKYKDDWAWYRAMFRKAGLGEVGLIFGILPYTRVIHAGVDKAHVFTGITRYTCAGEPINSEAEVDIVTWKKGRWGCASTGARIMMQDRVNDRANIRT